MRADGAAPIVTRDDQVAIIGALTRRFVAAMDAARQLGGAGDRGIERMAEALRDARAVLDVGAMAAMVRKMQGVASMRNGR